MALILLPTQELAQQTYLEVLKLAYRTPLVPALIHGGQDNYAPQVDTFKVSVRLFWVRAISANSLHLFLFIFLWRIKIYKKIEKFLTLKIVHCSLTEFPTDQPTELCLGLVQNRSQFTFLRIFIITNFPSTLFYSIKISKNCSFGKSIN